MSSFVEPSFFSYRRLNAAGFALCLGAIAFTALYLQEHLGFQPCQLCTATRLLVLGIATVFLFAFIHNPGTPGQRMYGAMAFSLTLTGIYTTIKHIWLQAQQIEASALCNMSTERLFVTMPNSETLFQLFQGATECATSQWRLMGLSIPEQSLLLFALLLIISWKQLRKKRQPRGLFR